MFNGAPDNNLSLAQLQAPASTNGIVETVYDYIDFNVTNGFFLYNNGNSSALFSGHTQSSNFLFLDGHVKSMRPLATLDVNDGGSNTQLNMWTNDNAQFLNMPGTNCSSVGQCTGQQVLSVSAKQYQ